MNFHINKGATLPVLKLELIKDGRNDYKAFHEMIQNATIKFTMTDIETGVKKIAGKDGLCVLKPTMGDCVDEEYYLAYQFSEKDTKRAGTYVGQFTITFLDGSGILKVPIREELFIHVLDGSIKK
jgi:hypothetical protein